MKYRQILLASLAITIVIGPSAAKEKDTGDKASEVSMKPIAPSQKRKRNSFQSELKKANKNLEASPRSLAILKRKADLLFYLGRRKEAVAVAEEVVRVEPSSAEAYKIAADIYTGFDYREQALEMIANWLELTPGHADLDALVMRSGVRDPADFAGREADIAAILMEEPQHIRGLYAKGRLELDRGDFTTAAETYSKLGGLTGAFRGSTTTMGAFNSFATSSSSFERNPQTLNLLAISLYRAGRAEEAEAAFKEARRNAGTSGYALNEMCWNKTVFNIAPARALEECEAALRSLPDDPNVLDSRGMIYLRLGKLAEARADFDRALWLSPEMASSLFARAIVEANEGDIAAATTDARAARALWPHADDSFRRWGYQIPDPIALR